MNRKAGVLALCWVLLCSCAGIIPDDVRGPSWPPPPARTRIRYLGSFSTPEELGIGRKSLARALGSIFFGLTPREILRPYGIAVSAGGKAIYVADPGLQAVHIFDRESRRYSLITGDRRERLLSPIGVAIDSQGRLHVADSELGKILTFEAGGKLLYAFGDRDGLQRPTGLVYAAGQLYVADTTRHQVFVYSVADAVPRFLFSFGQRGTDPGEFNYPLDMAVSRSGRLYVNDGMNFRIQIFDLEGRYLRAFGGPGQVTGYFHRSKGVALDSDENLYVADAAFDAIQVFDNSGRFLLSFGTTGETDGEFWMPTGLAVDERDTIYVADSYNRRIQMFQYVKEAAGE